MKSLDELYIKKYKITKEEVFRMFNGVDRSELDIVIRVIEPGNKRLELEML